MKKKSAKKKFSTKKYPIFDHQQVTDAFVDQLEKLEAHIRAHKMHTEWKRDADQIKTARGLYQKSRLSLYDKDERRLMTEFFEYVSNHILGWWC